jgi:hypothetical protein
MYFYQLSTSLDPKTPDDVIWLAHRAHFTDDEFTTLVCNVLPWCQPSSPDLMTFTVMRHKIVAQLCERYGFELVEASVEFVVPDRSLNRDPGSFGDETSRRLAQKLVDAGIITPQKGGSSIHWGTDPAVMKAIAQGLPLGLDPFRPVKALPLIVEDDLTQSRAPTFDSYHYNIIMDDCTYKDISGATPLPAPPKEYGLPPSSMTGGDMLKRRVLDEAVKAITPDRPKNYQQAQFWASNAKRKR